MDKGVSGFIGTYRDVLRYFGIERYGQKKWMVICLGKGVLD